MISPLLMLALDSDVCPTPVTLYPYQIAPLNTYTFLKSVHPRMLALLLAWLPAIEPCSIG
jgi:hypothetical protein